MTETIRAHVAAADYPDPLPGERVEDEELGSWSWSMSRQPATASI